MLGVVEAAITNSGDDFSYDEEREAGQVVSDCAGHDHRPCEMEERENDGEGCAAPFVNGEANKNAEHCVDEIGHSDEGGEIGVVDVGMFDNGRLECDYEALCLTSITCR